MHSTIQVLCKYTVYLIVFIKPAVDKKTCFFFYLSTSEWSFSFNKPHFTVLKREFIISQLMKLLQSWDVPVSERFGLRLKLW